MNTSFSPSKAIKVGWEITKKHFWFFAGLLILSCLVEIIPSGIANAVKETSFALYFVIIIAAWIVQLIIKMGLIKITLNIYDKGTAKMNDLFSCTDKLGKFILGALLYGLIVTAGIILLVVPGIIWTIKYQFFVYLIVDKNLGPMEAIKKSGEITMGNKWNLFLLQLLFIAINIAGVLCLIIGLFATVPLTMVASVYVYRKLMGKVAINNDLPVQTNPSPIVTDQSV